MIGSPLQWDQNLVAAQTFGRRQLPLRIAGELRSLQKDRFLGGDFGVFPRQARVNTPKSTGGTD